MTKKLLALIITSTFIVGCSTSTVDTDSILAPPIPDPYNPTNPPAAADVEDLKKIKSVLGLSTNALSIVIDGKTISSGSGSYSFTTSNTVSSVNFKESGTSGDDEGYIYYYDQTYSVVYGTEIVTSTTGNPMTSIHEFAKVNHHGFKTMKDNFNDLVSNNISATYKGRAFNKLLAGDLTYTFNFGTEKGSGSIENITGSSFLDKVTLGESASINKTNGIVVTGNAEMKNSSNVTQYTKKYELQFYGPDAHEIAGKIYGTDGSGNPNFDIDLIFAGKATK